MDKSSDLGGHKPVETGRSFLNASWTYDIEDSEVCAVAPSYWKNA